MLVANYVSPSEFAENFLDPLLDLVSDSVANVRLVVSRTIAENLLSIGLSLLMFGGYTFCLIFVRIDSFKPKESDLSPSALSVSLAVNQLLRDSDRDVRNFLAQVPDLAGFVTQGRWTARLDFQPISLDRGIRTGPSNLVDSM